MTRPLSRSLWVPLLLLLLLLCLGTPALAGEERPKPSVALSAANNAFAWDLFDALRGGEGNLFFSPYSVSSALLMAREGARGDTAAEMDDVLHLDGVSRSDGYAALVHALRAPMVWDHSTRARRKVPAYEINVANALFGQARYPFEADFLARLAGPYGAPLERVEFGDTAAARRRINAWVEQQTKEKIKDIVPEGMPPPQTRLVLANAIYFKAPWADPFSERATKDDLFHGPGGTQATVPFMHRVGRYGYGELEGVQMLELKYRGNTTSMVVFLPRDKDGLKALEEKLCGGKLAGWEKTLKARKVNVSLPRFEFTVAKDLTGTLPSMGMKRAFSPRTADFSGMTKSEKLFIGAVLHKAFVAVDEKGTEAAAATVLMMKGTSAPRPETPLVFKADHPFLFVIRHRTEGTILFSGRVSKP